MFSKPALRRWLVFALVLFVPLVLGSDCDDDDIHTGDILDIIYAIGDVVLAILREVL